MTIAAVALPVLAWQVQGQPKAIAWGEAQDDLFALGPRMQAALEEARTEAILGQAAVERLFHSALGKEDQLLDRQEPVLVEAIDAQVDGGAAGRWYFEALRLAGEPSAAMEALEAASAAVVEGEQPLALQVDLQKALMMVRLGREQEALDLLLVWEDRIEPGWNLRKRPAALIHGYRVADLHQALGSSELATARFVSMAQALLDGSWPVDLETLKLELSFLQPDLEENAVLEAYLMQQRLRNLPEVVASPGLALGDGALLLVDDDERQVGLFHRDALESWLPGVLEAQFPAAAPFALTGFQSRDLDPTLPSLPLDLSSLLLTDLKIYLPDLEAYVRPLTRRRAMTMLGVGALSALLLSLTWFGRRLLQREAALQRTRTEFLAGVSHELRTPAASLAMLSENLLEGRVEGKERTLEYYRSMRRDARRLERLVADVLDVTRMERGTFSMDRKPTDMKALLEGLVEEQAPRLADAGIRLECSAAEDLPTFSLDPFAVERAVANLLENIRRYASAGGWAQVRARVSANGGIEVTVEDRGPGIPSAWRERVFTPYERLPQDQATAAGAGLGLALVQAVLLAHGGTVRVEQGADQVGCRFVMEFPADA